MRRASPSQANGLGTACRTCSAQRKSKAFDAVRAPLLQALSHRHGEGNQEQNATTKCLAKIGDNEPFGRRATRVAHASRQRDVYEADAIK
ncbi:hypothetical protein FGB62_136g08 [Gracilaria domingensis]|nr:hypothetical protein FGB62_136g08 [Gracilaria domingensis]